MKIARKRFIQKVTRMLYIEREACIAPSSFDIYYTSEILNACIQKKPQWYTNIINKEQTGIVNFFRELLGQG